MAAYIFFFQLKTSGYWRAETGILLMYYTYLILYFLKVEKYFELNLLVVCEKVNCHFVFFTGRRKLSPEKVEKAPSRTTPMDNPRWEMYVQLLRGMLKFPIFLSAML